MKIALNEEASGDGRHPKTSSKASIKPAWLAFAVFHVFVMFSFAADHGNWLLPLPGPIVSFLSAYGYITGSSSGFSFFAPRVPDESMAEITVHHKDSVYALTLGAGNAERLRRVSTMLLQLDQNKGYVEGAALFSSYVFEHDDAATTVDVRFYRYQIGRLGTSDVFKREQQNVFFASFARSKKYAP